MSFDSSLTIGICINGEDNLAEALTNINIVQLGGENANFLVAELFRRGFKDCAFSYASAATSYRQDGEIVLPSRMLTTAVVGVTSVIPGLFSKNSEEFYKSCSQLRDEISLSQYLSLPITILPNPHTDYSDWGIISYCQGVMSALSKYESAVFWVPFVIPTASGSSSVESSSIASIWARIRQYVSFDSRLHFSVELPSEDSSMNTFSSSDHFDVLRTFKSLRAHPHQQFCFGLTVVEWLQLFSESFRCLFLPVSLFVPNRFGNPVLRPAHRALILLCAHFGVQIALTGDATAQLSSFVQDSKNAMSKRKRPLSTVERTPDGTECITIGGGEVFFEDLECSGTEGDPHRKIYTDSDAMGVRNIDGNNRVSDFRPFVISLRALVHRDLFNFLKSEFASNESTVEPTTLSKVQILPLQSNNSVQAVSELATSATDEERCILSFTRSVRDIPQLPLQPLAHTLDAATYEVFEADPVKYKRYEEAIHLALVDFAQLKSKIHALNSSSTSMGRQKVRVLVVGAGRGGLLLAAYRAAMRAGYHSGKSEGAIDDNSISSNSVDSSTASPPLLYELLAIEKNHWAVEALKALSRSGSIGPFEVFEGDLRDFRGIHGSNEILLRPFQELPVLSSREGQFPLKFEIEKCHILVSELLGSFGDNELSVECLDSAIELVYEQPCLQWLEKGASVECNQEEVRNMQGTGIHSDTDALCRCLGCRCSKLSIPASSTSFLAPVSASSAWMNIRSLNLKSYSSESVMSLEQPFVCFLHRSMDLADPQAVFRFDHPSHQPIVPLNGADIRINDRHDIICFKVEVSSFLYGLSGYFKAQLYRGVELSTVPCSSTDRMFSWFPLFFPFENPIWVNCGDIVRVFIARCSDSKGVWYEWALLGPTATKVHNKDGKHFRVGL